MLDELKTILTIPLQLWFVLVAVPLFIVFVMVETQSLVSGVVLTMIAFYPMYRILSKRENSQAEDMDSKHFLDAQGQEEAITYMLEQKRKSEPQPFFYLIEARQ